MSGPQNGVGDQWEQGGIRYTVNPADDPAAGPGGFYLNQLDLQTGAKATAVYDANYNLVNERDWR